MAYPVGPVIYAVYVNDVLIKDFALDVELRQCWGCHDLFFIRFERTRTDLEFATSQLWPDNAPVRVVWGRRPDNIHTWYGYVNHHVVNSNASSGSRALQITYVLIGTSKPMNTDKSRAWGDVSATYIARKIAGEYGLRAVISSNPWVIPYEVQSNESDFRFLNRLADKIGYRFWVSGGTLYFIDPAVVLYGAPNQPVPQYRLDKRFTQLDSIRDFEMYEGGNIPGRVVANRSIFSFDATSGNIQQIQANTPLTSPGAPIPDINYILSEWPAESVTEAMNLVNAWQQRNQYWQTACAELYGNAYLYPGKLVNLQGMQMPPNGSGFWIVASASHILKASGTDLTSSDKYVTQVHLLKNSTQQSPNLKSIVKITPEFTTCILNSSNAWISQQATVLTDGVLTP